MFSEKRTKVIERVKETNENVHSLALAIMRDIEIIKMYRRIFEYPIEVVMEIQMLVTTLNTDSKRIAEIGIKIQEIIKYTLENERFDLDKVVDQLNEINQRSSEIARIAGCELRDIRELLLYEMLFTQRKNL